MTEALPILSLLLGTTTVVLSVLLVDSRTRLGTVEKARIQDQERLIRALERMAARVKATSGLEVARLDAADAEPVFTPQVQATKKAMAEEERKHALFVAALGRPGSVPAKMSMDAREKMAAAMRRHARDSLIPEVRRG